MSKPDLERPGVWARLFPRALELMSHLEREVPGAPWTFGGGTVLMLRLGHRQSKDIDLFVPDPQYIIDWDMQDSLNSIASASRSRLTRYFAGSEPTNFSAKAIQSCNTLPLA